MSIKNSDFTEERLDMVRVIETEVKFTSGYTGKSKLNTRVVEALREVPRHEFVGDEMQYLAYTNTPLYIGHGQTISQPYIVAIMTELISPQKDHVVLDIGTGSGYQAAILSRLVNKVYSVEIIEGLAEQAKQRFATLQYNNIEVKVGDGYQGWQDYCPYDGIVVAATAPYIPTALVQQLKPGGKLIIPIGQPFLAQELVLVEKAQNGEISTSNILPVSFVPLVNKQNDIDSNIDI